MLSKNSANTTNRRNNLMSAKPILAFTISLFCLLFLYPVNMQAQSCRYSSCWYLFGIRIVGGNWMPDSQMLTRLNSMIISSEKRADSIFISVEDRLGIEAEIARGKDSIKGHNLLGYDDAIQGKYPEAILHFGESIRIAQNLSKQPKISRVQRYLYEAEEAVAHQGLGNVFLAMGKPDEAVLELSKARNLYQRAGYLGQLSQVRQQIQNVSKLRIVSPDSLR